MLKVLSLPFKIIKWFFILLFIALGLFLVGVLLYITSIMRDADTMVKLANPLGEFFAALNTALGGNVQWMKDWSVAMSDTNQIVQIANTSNIIFGVTIAVVCVGGVITVMGIIFKILKKVRKVST